MDPDPDSDQDPGSGSCYFRHWTSRCQQKTNFFTHFFCFLLLKLHLHHFSKIKSQKESQNSKNQGFSYYFCMILEGSGSGSREGSGSGSIPLTSGSGSRRPKNMWIRWIRIRNTATNKDKIQYFDTFSCPYHKIARIITITTAEMTKQQLYFNNKTRWADGSKKPYRYFQQCCGLGSGTFWPGRIRKILPDPDSTFIIFAYFSKICVFD